MKVLFRKIMKNALWNGGGLLVLLGVMSGLGDGASAAVLHPNIQTFTWGETEVVWLEDNRFPNFAASIYFDQGAAAEAAGQSGITQWTLNELDAGTKRYTQKEILSNLEYYGISYGAEVGQEYATFDFSGAVKFLPQTVSQICHLFTAANFPAQEMANEKKKIKTDLNNLAKNPDALVARASSLFWGKDTPWANPVNGRWASIQKFSGQDLQRHLKVLREQVKKKIYLAGPQEVLAAADYFKACGFKGQKTWNPPATVARKTPVSAKPVITFIPLPKSNQATISMGGWRPPVPVGQLAAAELANSFLGGNNFKSQLMQEIRVKHGLTYGIFSSLAFGRNFSRVVINTNGRNDKVLEILQRVQQKINDLREGLVLPEELAATQVGFAREKIFGLETAARYLGRVQWIQYLGGTVAELEDYPTKITQVERPAVIEVFKQIFDLPLQIVVAGHPSLKKDLAKVGTVRQIKLRDLW